ncbi:hypothetical protein HUJ05_004073, partial [Dendroctonus ponderosae]
INLAIQEKCKILQNISRTSTNFNTGRRTALGQIGIRFREKRRRGWYKSFLRRNSSLTERQTEAVTSASANVSENNIRGWFAKIEAYLRNEELLDIFKDPKRIFNSDETNF